ncbi:MAG: class I SAM-dependent methyltransferase [bacterium]|nr:class I SAM-dependent methyltransferase [bacterium]
MSSSDRFGYEWKTYNRIKPYQEQYKDQFLNWVYPLNPDFFAGKNILDAGCGMGRNSFWCCEFGAGSLTAFDKDSRSVQAAKENLAGFKQAKAVAADIYSLPWENSFDFVFSIGVIHHLKNPLIALAELKKTLRPGGEILIWVYGRDGFSGYVKALKSVRVITSRLPLPLLHWLTYFISLPFFIYLKILKPGRPYFKQLNTFAFSHLHSIIFDQLLPDVANYYSETEARVLLNGFREVEIHQPPNQNGWIVRGKK